MKSQIEGIIAQIIEDNEALERQITALCDKIDDLEASHQELVDKLVDKKRLLDAQSRDMNITIKCLRDMIK